MSRFCDCSVRVSVRVVREFLFELSELTVEKRFVIWDEDISHCHLMTRRVQRARQRRVVALQSRQHLRQRRQSRLQTATWWTRCALCALEKEPDAFPQRHVPQHEKTLSM